MAPSPTRGTPRHVLAINEDQAILALYRDLLEEEGYRVTTWTYPAADVGDIARLGPDLILMDVLFGTELVGLAFLDRLKADERTRRLPVLVSTAAGRMVEPYGERLAAWGCGLVVKPFDLETLLAEVRGCLTKADGRGRWDGTAPQ